MSTTGLTAGTNGKEAGWVTRLSTRDATGAEYQELKFAIHRKLLDRINLEALSSLATERARAEIRFAVAKLVEEERTPLSLTEKERVIEEVLDEVFGLGPLEPLLRDPTVSDILVTGPKLVYVERGGKLYRTSDRIQGQHASPAHYRKSGVARGTPRRRIVASGGRSSARRIARQRRHSAGRRRRPAALHSPFRPRPAAAARISSRSWPSPRACSNCSKRRARAPEHPDLRRHRLGQNHAAERAVELHPENERIVTIEDAAELRLRQTHVARMETRPANIEGHGAIKIRDLVINALRMRPDRIIVGEVRSEEALDMLQAMNTGHDGSLTTIHSNTPRDGIAPSRSDGRHGQRQYGRARHPPAGFERRRSDGAGGPLQRRYAAR